MKKLAAFLIFSFFIVFLSQQEVFAEIEGKEDREKAAKEAANFMKRESNANDEDHKIEEKEVIKEKEVRKIPSELIKLLPTENKLEEITYRIIWKYIDKQSTMDEEVGIETTTALLRDISRVYDPIVNKYKVSTIQIEIIKYDDKYELEHYWDEISNSSIEKIFSNAYLIGSPNEGTDCMFNYSKDGAMTICKTDEYVI
ncbi:hypothetical protein PQY74_02725, partial [Nitrosopumilus sp.]|nr:hypothetical protein [Nitrosopumilus sp.]